MSHLTSLVPRCRAEVLSLFLLALLSAPFASGGANAKKPIAVDPNSQEGYLLELIQAETNVDTKLLLFERFVKQFPKFDSLDAVYSDMQALYIEAGQYGKAIDAGVKLLAIDPQDITCARRNLEAAQQKKDAALIKEWNGRVRKLAEELSASAPPKSPDDAPIWQERVNIARQLIGSEEYNLYKKAYEAAEPRKKVELLDQLERQYPKG